MSGSYRQAGVDISAQEHALQEVARLARATYSPAVLGGVGAFGGLYRPALAGVGDPVLVASADGVGTKLTVARLAGDFSTVGHDLVNHCVNDILAQGARPLFFLDYVGAGTLDPDAVVELVRGVAAGCRENGCALLGGETAEMPGFYQPGDYELVGFIVGLVDGSSVLGRERVVAGDVLLGLAATGLHTNGYSLARRILFEEHGLAIDDPFPGSGRSVAEVLLAPHRSYLRAIAPILGDTALHGVAHITGGGLTDNVPRILPAGLGATIWTDSWQVPAVFRELERLGQVPSAEMFQVFNMGIGLVLAVDARQSERLAAALAAAGQPAVRIGTVREGESGVLFARRQATEA